jgi:hypothetical protein
MLSVATRASYSVRPLAADDLPWLVRVRLRSPRKKGRTGLIVYGIIRTPPRSISRKRPYVSIHEGNRRLGICSPTRRLPKWASLAPGERKLLFLAGRPVSFSAFEERVALSDGDVLVAICEPVQPSTFYAKSPEADTWYLGIIDSAGRWAAVSARRGLR